ncbi:unnamed protein product [Rodentolepis nana]|uniref:Uncharacterized protein n=1 Tax=Rodentolepis nana TaxID=102285 RepID=A0A0R3TCP6_RODNA|nr:unnamed protein product [Rodentolepis nana]
MEGSRSRLEKKASDPEEVVVGTEDIVSFPVVEFEPDVSFRGIAIPLTIAPRHTMASRRRKGARYILELFRLPSANANDWHP